MKLVYLGTSGACPTLKRGLSSTVLILEKESIIVDCGEGTQFRYLKAGLKWNKPLTILFTHLHSDHCMGVFGLLQTMELQGRSEPVKIYGPSGTNKFIKSVKGTINLDFSFDMQVTEIGDGYIIYGNDHNILCKKSDHQVPSIAYLFVEYNRAGSLDAPLARELGVEDGPDMARLKAGEDIVVNKGTSIVHSKDVVSPPRKGRRIGFSGDTRPNAGLEEFFKECDYLTFESTFLEDEKKLAVKAKHSTALEAGYLAKRAGVKHLFLNHFSARHTSGKLFEDEAFQAFTNVKATYDLMEVKIR